MFSNMQKFDVDWWSYWLIGLAGGLDWMVALVVASALALITRNVEVPDNYHPIRSYGSPKNPDFSALPAYRND